MAMALGDTVIARTWAAWESAGECGELMLLLRYDTADPYAVELHFPLLPDRPSWVVGRELLIDGRVALAGVGDVLVSPTPEGAVDIMLRTVKPGEADLTLTLSRAVLDTFLANTLLRVPLGRERQHLDLDGELRALLRLGQ